MQCSVGDGMLGPLPPTHARLRTPPHGRAKWEPRGPLVQSRRLLHGRIWPWPCLTVPWPRWSGISLGQERFGPCSAPSAVGCSAHYPLTHARLRTPPRGRAKWVPGGPLVRSRRLLHGRIWPWPGPTVPRPRWSGISLGQEQFGPCRAPSTMGCSAHCPLRMLGCVRRPVAELNGCQEANWCGRVDFCTGGFGRGRARPCHGLVGRGFP